MEIARDIKGYNGVFAVRLREIMEDKKITQEVLAKQTGMTRQTISQYMDGSIFPNVEKLYKICAYFNVPSDYLLGFTNSQSYNISDRHIQDTLGLTDEAIRGVEDVHLGRNRLPNQLFLAPSAFEMGVVNQLLSNKHFMLNYPKRLIKYFEKKQEDDAARKSGRVVDSDETDIEERLLEKLFIQLVNDCYNDYYKPSIRKARRKPGRKRKTDETDNGSADV